MVQKLEHLLFVAPRLATSHHLFWDFFTTHNNSASTVLSGSKDSVRMNDGDPDKRSSLAPYSVAKTPTDTEQPEKALFGPEKTPRSFDTTKSLSPHKNDESSDSGQPKDGLAAHLPPRGASKEMVDIMKAAADAREDDDDFDMSMVPMSFPQRVSTRILHVRKRHLLWLRTNPRHV